MRGAPLRLELGPKDVEKGVVTAVRRDTREKAAVPRDKIAAWVAETLETIQGDMLAAAASYLQENTKTVDNRDDFYSLLEGRPGFVRAPWCGETPCEDNIAAETGATIRFIPLEPEDAGDKSCAGCGGKAKVWAYFAKAY